MKSDTPSALVIPAISYTATRWKYFLLRAVTSTATTAAMPKPAIEFQPTSAFGQQASPDLLTTLLSQDSDTGDQTAILQHVPGSTWGQPHCAHEYWEECYILEGRLFDETLQRWFEAGHYCCRPPGMIHGPYRADPERGCKEICFIIYRPRKG